MKALPYHILFLSILMGWTARPASAQTPFDEVFWEEAAQIQEKIQLFTDRSIYAVEETIHFVADYKVSGPIGDSPWSSLLYVELIAPTGEPVAQGKFQLSGGRAAGTLHIPAESLTGVYYLKCYTRWMRNRGPGSFSYMALKVINPYRPEVLVPAEGGNRSGSLQKIPGKEGVVVCLTDSERYHKGEEGIIQVQGASPGDPTQIKYCVTVVPSGAIDRSVGQYISHSAEELPFMVRFLPDRGSGVSISGTVIGPDQLPAPYARLHFSLLGKNPDFFATMSDENGRFVVATTAGSGDRKEFFVTPEQEEGKGLEVRIDQEYDSRPVLFPWELFRLSDNEMELARKIALNMQLSKAFRPEAPPVENTDLQEVAEEKFVPFYGTRVKRLLIDDYVRLPNLEEIFINLVPEVQFYRKQGESRIRIISDNSSIGVYNPLIMIDHISVFDHEALLALSPEKIERIDLINEIYLKGNVAFGGVLAIYSRKGDMAGIDLPKGSYFFDYQSIQSETPATDPLPVQEGRVPDTRNTVFWSSELQMEQGGQLEIPFMAPASAGDYWVLIRGLTPGGEVFSSSASFSVE